MFVLNTLNRAATEYDVPVKQVVVHGGRTFGLTDNKLVELTGSTDDGDSIEAYINTGLLAFDNNNTKVVPKIYIYANADNGVHLETRTEHRGVITEAAYDSLPLGEESEGVLRIHLGRGVRGTATGLKVYNIDGGNLDIESCVLSVVQTSSRR